MSKKLKFLPLSACMGALGVFMLSTSPVLGVDLSFEDSVTSAALDWPIIFGGPLDPPIINEGKPLHLNKFDSSLGHLDAVRFEIVEFNTSTPLSLQNTSQNVRTFKFAVSTLLSLYRASGAPTIPVQPAIVSTSATAVPLEFMLNPQNTAGSTFGPIDLVAGLNAPIVQNFFGDIDVAPFIAASPTDLLNFEAGTETSIQTTFPDNNSGSWGTTGSIRIRVTYSYTPPPSANCVTVNAVAGVPITPQTLVPTGGAGAPYTFLATGLPNGLGLDLNTGILSGTPTAPGVFPYTVTITDKDGNIGTLNCSVAIQPPSSADCVVLNATKGVAITPVTLGANGGCGAPYTFSAAGLPAGLTMKTGGTISGTPTVSGTFSYQITVTDKCGNAGNLSCEVTVGDNCVPAGTATIGYWKNHPEAWPVESITIGGVTYTKAQAIKVIGSSGSNASLLLAKQLIAAKLSAMPSLCNDSSCVTIDIVRADQLLALYPIGSTALTASRNEILAVKTKLDDYNNGRLCEAHRN